MLVLSRKCEESIVINGEIEIKIIDISGERVRIGVEAPKNYKVFRKELLATIKNNQQAVMPVETKNLQSFLSGFHKNLKPPKKDEND